MRRHFKSCVLYFSLCLVLALMVAIFCFSSQNSEESGALSARVTAVVLGIVHPDFDRLDASQRAELLAKAGHIVRKCAHFSEFAALGFFLLGFFKALSWKIPLRRPALVTAVTGALYAVSDELHQGFVSGRSTELLDVVIDSAGVLFGILVMGLLFYLRRKWEDRKT
ncbi:MAG: VanZ family protein [Oscillospiraceae bacterium]|nr:VanZ family protein [Oscillospiraceae bacterium]